MTIRLLSLIGATALALGLPAAILQASPDAEVSGLTPEKLTWVDDAKSPGVKTAALSGSESSETFVRRRQYPAGHIEAPHTHPAAIYVTVLSGSLRIGTGATYDEKKLVSYPAGGFVAIPGGVPHFGTMPESTILQIGGNAPHGATPVAMPAKSDK